MSNCNIGGVYHLCRSGIYSVPTENGDIRIAVCGGGDSKDKEKRTDGVDWFEEEAVTEADVQKLLERAAAHRMEVDYFLSHALSSAVKSEWNYECARCAWGNGGSFEPSESDYRIRDLIGRIRARTYFSAHEHIDREFLLDGKRYRSVYRDFVRL